MVAAAELTIEQCGFCQQPMARCPKCGNNSCNGGYGEIAGKQCDMCPSVYDAVTIWRGNFTSPSDEIEAVLRIPNGEIVYILKPQPA